MKIVKQEISIESDLQGIDILKKLERRGRTCYQSENKITSDSCIKFVEMILRRGHGTVLEQHDITVLGKSNKAIIQQLFRHRLTSPLAESTRFVNYKKTKELEFLMPKFKDTGYTVTNLRCELLFKQTAIRAEKYYNELLSYGQPPEVARDLLPIAHATNFIVKANLREWRHILSCRNEKHADPQMIELASMIEEQLKELVPIVFEGIHGKD